MQFKKNYRRWLTMSSVLLLSSEVSFAVVTLPLGDTLLNGSFDEIQYGETGVAYLLALMYTGELGVTESPVQTDITTPITYDYRIDDVDTSLMTITYTVGNEGSQAFTDLRFFVNVQPDGSPSFNDTAVAVWGDAAMGDPSHYQLADFNDNLSFDISVGNELSNGDTCGGSCDVDFALRWSIAQLNPGEIAEIVVGLSDNGQALSSRYLLATSVDSANTELTFSGAVSIVPLPPAALLFFGAASSLLVVRRRSPDKTSH